MVTPKTLDRFWSCPKCNVIVHLQPHVDFQLRLAKVGLHLELHAGQA